METKPQRPKEHKGIALALNAVIEVLDLAKELSSITPAKAVFGSVSVILRMIRVSLLVFVDRMQSEVRLGRDGEPDGLLRTWAGLR